MRKLIVSLHDVTPALEDRSRRMVDRIMKSVGSRFTLLVVPDYHSKGRLDRFPEFCAWLRELQGIGVEIAQHGYTHLDFSHGRTLSGRFLTDGEGEFSACGRQEAESRVAEGLSILSDALGMQPSGFTAPAWLYSRGTLEALRSFPFRWLEHRPFIDCGGGTREFAPVIVFASRTRWKRTCSGVWSAVAPLLFSTFPEIRVALHVRDFPLLEREVSGVLEKVCPGRAARTCGELAQTT